MAKDQRISKRKQWSGINIQNRVYKHVGVLRDAGTGYSSRDWGITNEFENGRELHREFKDTMPMPYGWWTEFYYTNDDKTMTNSFKMAVYLPNQIDGPYPGTTLEPRYKIALFCIHCDTLARVELLAERALEVIRDKFGDGSYPADVYWLDLDSGKATVFDTTGWSGRKNEGLLYASLP